MKAIERPCPACGAEAGEDCTFPKKARAAIAAKGGGLSPTHALRLPPLDDTPRGRAADAA